jgi:hypothetical protein
MRWTGFPNSTQAGVAFVFGFLAGGPQQPYALTNPASMFVFAFRVLPVILVVCALAALLWHWRILKWITQGFGMLSRRPWPARTAGAGDGRHCLHGPGGGPDFHSEATCRASRARNCSC